MPRPSMYPITQVHMNDALRFVEEFWRINGCAPTFRQIGGAIGLKSPSHVSKVLYRMRDAQMVEFKQKKRRTIKPFGWDAQKVMEERLMGSVVLSTDPSNPEGVIVSPGPITVATDVNGG